MLFGFNVNPATQQVAYNPEGAPITYRSNEFSIEVPGIFWDFMDQPALKNDRNFMLIYAHLEQGRLVMQQGSKEMQTDPEIVRKVLKNDEGIYHIPWELQTDLSILYAGLKVEKEKGIKFIQDRINPELKNKFHASTVFATVILLNDEFKKLKQNDSLDKRHRFWTITLNLPNDIQQILINRLFNIKSNFIFSNGIDDIIKSLINE